jgi:membrane-associated phospholipid phosphatase
VKTIPSRDDAFFWGWPSRRLLILGVLLGSCQVVWFFFIYGGANYLTQLHSYRVRLHFDWELYVPFVPAMVLGYMSIYPLFVLAPFILRNPREIVSLVRTLGTITLVAGISFLVLPADLHFPAAQDSGHWTWLVEFAKRVALENNLMPSLHVGMSAVCVLVYAPRAGGLGKLLLWLWSAFISASTILIHQHYVVDVVTGYVVAWAGVQWGYRRWALQKRWEIRMNKKQESINKGNQDFSCCL